MTAQFIVRSLTKKTRQMWPLGYETVRLLFTNDDFVRAADWGPKAFEEVERLLRLGERPLGFIARMSERRVQPFVESWVGGDAAAIAKLNEKARFWYHHRMLSESEYQENSNNGDGQKTRKPQ
jgi:hypothetical protein